MRCLVTAGPTYEPIDQVRRLTNFSTGRLGATLASLFAEAGHEVVLLRGYYATVRVCDHRVELVEYSSTSDLNEKLSGLAPHADAVFHAAAVSDFRVKRVFQRVQGQEVELKDGKIPTSKDNLFAEFEPTRKILPGLRNLFPQAYLVGWKYEVDGDRAASVKKGREQLSVSQTDACVINGPSYGAGFGLLRAEDGQSGRVENLANESALAARLLEHWRLVRPQ